MKPEVVCLCGSTRFKAIFHMVNQAYSLKGVVVLSVGVFSHADRLTLSAEERTTLTKLHLRKIDMCDRVFVLNVAGYIGSGLRDEIAYAQSIVACLYGRL